MTNSTRCALLAKQACTTLSHVVQKITPPSANNFFKLFFALFAMLALGVGNAWAEEAEVYSADFTSVEAHGYTQNKTFTLSSKSWTSSVSQVSNKVFYLGCNTNNDHKAKGILNDNSTFSEIVTILKSVDSKYSSNVTTAHAYAMLFDNAYENVTKVSFGWAGGNNAFQVYLFGYSNSSWSLLKHTDYATSGAAVAGSVEWTGEATDYTRFAIVARPGTSTSVAASKTLRASTFKIYATEDAGGTEEPAISVEPQKVDFGTKNIYFESEKQGSLEIDITGQNLTGDVTAEISGADASVFTLSKTTFTPEDGAVSEKLTVSYEVSEEKEYSATLILSSDGVEAIELPITLTTVNKKPTIYTKVTDAATLSAGDKVIFVYETDKKAAGAFPNGKGYLEAIDITQALNTSANPATASITDEAVIEYTLGGTTGAWEFISANGKLSEASANSTKSVDLAYNKGTTWTIAISSGNATIKGTTNTIQYNNTTPRFKTYTSGQETIQLYAISVPKYAVTFSQPENGELVVKNGENAISSGDTFAEGTILNVTTTPNSGYEGGTIVVKNASDVDITSTVYADGVLTMPAYAVTISATFEKKECTLLATPTVSATTTYNSATLSWGAVTNAAKYSVKVGTADAIETTETSYEVTGLTAETEYTYQVQAIAEADQDTYCDSEVAEDSFTTTAAPVATLTLSDIEGTTTQEGALNGTITLPTTAAECSKTFVGWDADENCDHAPTYAPGAEYTFTTVDPTLYAVYADGEGGGDFTITKTMSEIVDENEYTVSEGNNVTCYTSLTLDENITLSTTGQANCGSFWNNPHQWRLYQNKSGNAIVTAYNGFSLTSVKFTFTVSEGGTLLNDGIALESGKAVTASGTSVTYLVGDTQDDQDKGQVRITAIEVSYSKEGEYSNYSTTCAAAPKAEVNPTEVTATAAGVEGKVTVTYENVNTENVAIALFNDEACTEAFTVDWLTASLDGDKNITYTVAATTLYTERKAYIQLTAPETTGATDPDVVVIPVTQAAKEKVFASLAELVAADLTKGDEVTVTLNNDVIKDFYIYSSKRCGVVFDVQKDGKDIKIYFNNQTTIDDWAVGGKLLGTLTNVEWTTYSSAWQLAPANTWAWANLTYTEPKAVSTVVVSGAPTKTTYVDGEAFDPAGLTVTVNYNDATSEVNPTGVTFTVTPATLVKDQTSVSVTATYNSVTSAAYEVTGLTVNDIPTKTVDEFIKAEGGRCYLEGIVSNITNTIYGNFDLTDASGTIYVYGCLNAAGEEQKFAELGVKNGDKIKVIADEYELFGGTKDEAKNVQYVSHISAATITIADITMEVDEVKTISATVEPAEAEVTYTIKENAANAISLEGNTITALEEGTATITATVAEGATYLGNSVDFTVTVGPKTESDEVVILAELDGKWYAMKGAVPSGKSNQLDAIEVTYFNGTLYNVAEEVKASITWTRTIVDGKATFVNNGQYLKGGTSTNLTLVATVDDACKWMWNDENGYYTTNTSGTIRTFLYRENFNFKNYGVSQAGTNNKDGNYSSLPVVTAPVYSTEEFVSVYTRTVTPGNYGTICLPYAVNNYTGATFYEVAGEEDSKIVFDEVTELDAGTPYIFMAEAAEIKLAQVGEEYTGSAQLHNSLQGTFEDITDGVAGAVGNILEGNYMVVNNVIKMCGANCGLKANRAYFVAEELGSLLTAPQPMPGRRRVSMGVTGENGTTDLDNITTTNTPVKVIENGQLIIIRDGVKYNVQGQKL